MSTSVNTRGIKPMITGTLTLHSGTIINLTNSDFAAGSFNYTAGTSNSNEFTVGGAVISACKFQLLNDSGRFDNIDWYDSHFVIALDFPQTTVNLGTFYTVSHKETGSRIAVEAYDALKYLDEYQIYEDWLSYPASASDIVTEIATNRGLTVSGMRYPQMEIIDPNDDTMTEREFVSYVAQMMGQYVVVRGNALVFGWYDTGTVYNAGTSFSHDLRTDNITIGSVKVTANDDETVENVGSGGYLVEISDNPFITATNIQTIAQQIYSAVHGISFRPGSVALMSDASIQAGDFLSVSTGVETVTVLATNITYKPTLRESVTADADPVASDLRLSKTDRIKKIASKQANSTIADKLADSNSDLSRAIAGGGSSAKRTGGANNQYGTYSNYNAANRRTVYIDNTGIKLGQQASLDITAGYSGTVASKACTAKWFMSSDETTGATNDGTPQAPVDFKRTRTQNGLVTDRHQGGRDTTANPASMFAQVDFGVGPDGSGNFGEGPAGLSVRVETAGSTASSYSANLRHEQHIGNPEQDTYVSADPIYKSFNYLHGVTSLLGLFRMDQARIYRSGTWYPGFIIKNEQSTATGSTATYCAIWMQGFPAGPSDSGVAVPVIYIQACDYRGIVNANAPRYKIDITTA